MFPSEPTTYAANSLPKLLYSADEILSAAENENIDVSDI